MQTGVSGNGIFVLTSLADVKTTEMILLKRHVHNNSR